MTHPFKTTQVAGYFMQMVVIKATISVPLGRDTLKCYTRAHAHVHAIARATHSC